MYYLLLWGYLSLVPSWGTNQPVCKLRKKFNLPSLYKDGNIILGGIFHFHYHLIQQLEPDPFTIEPQPLECNTFNFREFRFAQTMIFAIEEINRSTKLLPNVTLGYQIYDGCSSETQSVKAVMALISTQNETRPDFNCTVNSKVPAIFADAGFVRSLAETMLTGPFGISTISFTAMCQCFGDHEFPTLFETVPSDSHQITAITTLVKHFGWNWVGLIRSSSTYITMESETILSLLEKMGICTAFQESFSDTDSKDKIQQIVKRIKEATTKIVIAFATLTEMEVLLQEVVRQNLTGIQWIASDSWVTAPILSPEENARFLVGTLGFIIPKADIPGLKEFLLQVNPNQSPANPLINEFWEKTFHCSMQKLQNGTQCNPESHVQQCTGNELLETIDNTYTYASQLRSSYRLYRAVYVIAHALHNIFSCGNDSCLNMSDIQPWQLLNYLGTLQSTDMKDTDIHSHQDENWIQRYELVNRQISDSGDVNMVKVGKYDASESIGHELKISEKDIVWSGTGQKVPQGTCSESCPPGTRKAMRPGEPVCCFDCVECHDADISNTTDAVFCMRCPLEYWPNQYRNECLPKEIEFLSFQDSIGVALTTFTGGGACLTVAMAFIFFKYRHTPLVRANNSELSFFLLLSLFLCFLSALTFIAHPSPWSCGLRYTIFGVTFALCLSSILGKTMVVLLAFKTLAPNTHFVKWFNPKCQRIFVLILTSVQCVICILWIILSPPYTFKSLKYYQNVISLECIVGSIPYFCIVFTYIFFLAGVTLVLAFLARKLPDSFNEATHITFSLLVFFAVWITLFPVYICSPEKYAAAVHAFAILSSCYGLLLCIFAPKCYIILLKPEKNTRKRLMTFSSN